MDKRGYSNHIAGHMKFFEKILNQKPFPEIQEGTTVFEITKESEKETPTPYKETLKITTTTEANFIDKVVNMA